MAEYLGFESEGCDLNGLRVWDFEYSHPFGIRLPGGDPGTIFGIIIFPSLSDILVTPRSDPSLGAGAALRIAPRFSSGFWNDVIISFNVASFDGPAIIRNELVAEVVSIANLESAHLTVTTLPGGSMSILAGSPCFGSPPEVGVPVPPACDEPWFRQLSIPPTVFQEIDILGINVRNLEVGFATPTPEPTTLLLWGTGAAGMGAVRWWKRRRAVNP